MLFGISLTDAIQAIGVFGIAAMVFAESGMLVGFFLPGDTLLFTAGFLTHQGTLNISIHLLVAILFVAAVVGDSIGYVIGRKAGRLLFKKPDSLLFRQENLRKAERFYEKFGPFTVVIARFIPMVRTFGPIVAGIGNMRYAKFLTYDIIGGALWVGTVTYLGYYGGQWLKANGIHVEMLVMPVLLLAVLASLASPIYHILRDPKSRATLLKKLGVKRGKPATDADAPKAD